jgi:hypothetical protein
MLEGQGVCQRVPNLARIFVGVFAFKMPSRLRYGSHVAVTRSTKAREATHAVDQDLAAIDVAGRVFSSSSVMDLTLAIVAKRLRSAYSVRSRIASTPNSSPGLS